MRLVRFRPVGGGPRLGVLEGGARLRPGSRTGGSGLRMTCAHCSPQAATTSSASARPPRRNDALRADRGGPARPHHQPRQAARRRRRLLHARRRRAPRARTPCRWSSASAPMTSPAPATPSRSGRSAPASSTRSRSRIVIGDGGKDIPRERALDHVFGYTICNDVSGREPGPAARPARGELRRLHRLAQRQVDRRLRDPGPVDRHRGGGRRPARTRASSSRVSGRGPRRRHDRATSTSRGTD